MIHKTLIAAAVAASLAGVALPSSAQSRKDFNNLRTELKALRAELDAIKKDKAAAPMAAPAPAPVAVAPAPAVAAPAPVAAAPALPAEVAALPDRVDALEIKAKDAVVGGDIPGSFRLPGSETSVKVYGFAEMQMIQDFRGTAPGDNFTNLMEQPLNGRDAGFSKGKNKLTAQTSRFGFETSTPSTFGPFNTKIEADFYAYCGAECNRNRLRLRHAYGEYAGFLVGQTWSTFMDLDDLPETVDFNGPIGAPFSRRTMIRYSYADVKEGTKYTVAIEDPEDGARLPNLVARFDKAFTWGTFNVRGLSHEKRLGAEKKRGYGVGVGGSYKLTSEDTLFAQWARVEGDADMMYGSWGYAKDANGRLAFDKNDGAVLGWTRIASPQLRGTVALGMNRSKGNPIFDNQQLTQLHVGAIYSPFKNIELGGEYIYGKRKTFDGDTGIMSRVDMMARYMF